MNSPGSQLSQLPGQWLNQPVLPQQVLKPQLPADFEEVIKGYYQNVERKQKQCEYQKRYLQKKKDQFNQLSAQVEQLQQQNKNLMTYYNVVQLLQQQQPQLLDQLIKQVSQLSISPNPQLNSGILSPTHFQPRE
jgi:Tfp pilus assembly protein PilO